MNIKSLHIKVSFSVAIVALLVVVVSAQFFYQRDYARSFAESERSVLQLLETVQPTAAISAYVGNRELAGQVVTGLTQNDTVLGARITANNEVIGEDGKEADKMPRQDTIAIPLVAPFDEQEIVGELAVVPNTELISTRARSSAMSTAISLAAQSALVALLVLVLVYWLMTRPLSDLSGSLHRITPGDGSRLRVNRIHRGDEIGQLAGDINVLLQTVEKMLEEERQLRHRVELLETRFRGIFEDSSAAIFLVRERGALVTANPAFFLLTGVEDTALETGDEDIVTSVFLDNEQALSLIRLALVTKRPHSADLRIRNRAEEQPRWVHCIFSPASSTQHNATVEGVMYDVTQRKLSEARIRTLAETDSLTGLSNRQAADSALQALITQTPVGGEAFAVMLIDLDRFKHINDTYGHHAGDTVLTTVASRLRSLVRESDVVARMGGDEFFIILNHAGNIAMVTRIAQKILDAQQVPIEVQANVWEKIGMSIGIALYPEHGDNPLSLRKHADQAMYAVKRRGKNNYAIYNPGTHSLEEPA